MSLVLMDVYLSSVTSIEWYNHALIITGTAQSITGNIWWRPRTKYKPCERDGLLKPPIFKWTIPHWLLFETMQEKTHPRNWTIVLPSMGSRIISASPMSSGRSVWLRVWGSRKIGYNAWKPCYGRIGAQWTIRVQLNHARCELPECDLKGALWNHPA